MRAARQETTLPLNKVRALRAHLNDLGIMGNMTEMVAEAFAFLLTASVHQVAHGTGLSSTTVKRTMKAIADQRPEQNV